MLLLYFRSARNWEVRAHEHGTWAVDGAHALSVGKRNEALKRHGWHGWHGLLSSICKRVYLRFREHAFTYDR